MRIAGVSPRRLECDHALYLCGDDHLVADAALLHPFSDELLGCSVLVVVRRVDEVTAGLVERIEQLQRALLVHLSETKLVPLVSDAHASKAQRRHMDTSKRGELAGAAELGLGLRGRLHLG